MVKIQQSYTFRCFTAKQTRKFYKNIFYFGPPCLLYRMSKFEPLVYFEELSNLYFYGSSLETDFSIFYFGNIIFVGKIVLVFQDQNCKIINFKLIS